MRFEDINEPIEVIASFRQTPSGNALVLPEIMNWHQRRYRITTIGMRHPTTKGQRMLHRFTFTIDEAAFEVELDAERLTWMLLRIGTLA